MRIFKAPLTGLLLAAAGFAQAWEDPFTQWKAGGYLQLLQVLRPPKGLPPSGPLDAYGRASDGYNQDGLYWRKLEAKMEGPLGFEGWSAVVGVQTDPRKAAIADAYVERAWERASLKLGQCRLPLGWENQLSSSKLPTLQRSLLLGLGNYGHVQDWGLGLVAERGWGLRLDASRSLLGPLSWLVQAGGFYARGSGYYSAWSGIARAGLKFEAAWFKAEAAFTGHLGHGKFDAIVPAYAALGLAQTSDTSLWERATVLDGRMISTWGPGLSLDLGPLHGRAEMLLQSLGPGTRGGGQMTAWCELPSFFGEARKPSLYARLEQAWSAYADGIHRPGALYLGQSLGFSLPLPFKSTLKLEQQMISCEDFGGPLPAGSLSLAQWQVEL